MRFYTKADLPSPCAVRDLWQEIREDTRPIVVYGTGNGADKLSAYLAEQGREIADFFASDGFCRGQSFHGRRVLSFGEIREKYDDFIILVAFGSTRREVLDTVYALDEEYTLRVPELPLAEKTLFDAAFYAAHYADIIAAYDLLADAISQSIFVSLILYRLSGRLSYLKNAVYTEDEGELLGLSSAKIAVDVGAYRGDTLTKWRAEAPSLSRVYAIEPDAKNFAKLLKVSEDMPFEVRPIHAAAYDVDGEATFMQSGNRNATLQKTDETASFQHRATPVQTVRIATVVGEDTPDLIKFDTEGAEAASLRGSASLISRAAPNLLVSAYHKSQDIFSLLLLLAEEYPSLYRYYLRRIECIPGWEINLLAVKQ